MKPENHSGHMGHKMAEGESVPKKPEKHDHHAHMVADFRKRFWVSLVVTIPVLVLSPAIQGFLGFREEFHFPGDIYLLFVLSSFIYFYGGFPFLSGALGELKEKSPGMMTLIGMAITTAYGYSAAVVFGLKGMVFFWELATLIDIMLLGHWIEMRSIMGASRALEELARLMPSEAHLVQADGSIKDIPIEELKKGEKVLVKPGEKVPADGEVTGGETSVNEAMLTGESKPVSKKTGARVIGGSINGEGSIQVEIKKTGKDSFISQVIALVKEAQESKSRTQDIANRAAMWLTIIALSVGAATLFAWTGILGRELAFSVERAVTVMVIACPHALGLAVPLVVAVSTALSAKRGLLIRNRAAFERGRNIRAVIFDKTGTLTEGRFAVTDVIPFNNHGEKEILKYAASVESHSEHPIAKGILAASAESYPVKDFRAIPGKGAQALVNERNVKVVSPGYLKERDIDISDENVAKVSAQGKTVVFLLIDEKPAGALALGDIIRKESREAVEKLKQMGILCMMLTGDNRYVAKWVAEELGLADFFAEVLPEEKSEKVKEVQSRGLITAMVGDGVNDAPALAQADVGIAIGAGTDVALETADVVLVSNDPRNVADILGLSRATYRKMIQNLIWATGYNIFAIPAAAGVFYSFGLLLSPALGAALMSLSTVIVSINATLLRNPRL